MKVVFVRALYGEYTEIFRKNKFAAIGWFTEPIKNFADKNSIVEQYKKQYPKDSSGAMYQNVGQIYRFCNEISEGDILISTYGNGSLIIGKAKGKTYFKKDDLCKFYIRINVDWLPDTFDRYKLSIPAQNTIKSSLTVFNVGQINEIASLAGYAVPKEENKKTSTKSLYNEPVVFESIKTKLLQLDDQEFEILVSYILQSLGFEATKRSGNTSDGGVDVEGVLDVMGLASAKLQVQVKRYDHSVIPESTIRSFRGALKRDHQGTFITLSDFNKKAIESANDSERVVINLVNGKRLIEIFIQQYEKVIALIENDEQTVLQQKLKFKKIIIPE
jgi:restriction system protein